MANSSPSKEEQAKYIKILGRLNSIYVKFLSKKNVTILCGYLAKLISKITTTIIQLLELNSTEMTLESLGTDAAILKDIIGWITKLQEEEEKDMLALYSGLLQNLSEMTANFLIRLPEKVQASIACPEHIKASMDLMQMFGEIDASIKSKKLSTMGNK